MSQEELSPEEKLQGLVLGVLVLLGLIIFIALALLKVFLILGIVLICLEIILAIAYLISKNEILETPLKWVGIAILLSMVMIFIFYLIGVVFGNSFIGQQSKEVFQLFVNVSKPISLP